MRARLLVSGAAVAALAFGAVSCTDGAESAECVNWDHDKIKVTVTPSPSQVRKQVYDKVLKKKVWRWVDKNTPKPYVTTSMKVECEEWATPTPTNS